DTTDHPPVKPFGPYSLSVELVALDPILVVVRGSDLLKGCADVYTKRLKTWGKKIEYVEFEGQQHGFFTIDPITTKGLSTATNEQPSNANQTTIISSNTNTPPNQSPLSSPTTIRKHPPPLNTITALTHYLREEPKNPTTEPLLTTKPALTKTAVHQHTHTHSPHQTKTKEMKRNKSK
ncbi:Abhydrolase_3 domain-containing protein, partial [Cephalotus follicularis]